MLLSLLLLLLLLLLLTLLLYNFCSKLSSPSPWYFEKLKKNACQDVRYFNVCVCVWVWVYSCVFECGWDFYKA